MAWQNPKTDWTSADGVTNTDFNRIEGNVLHLYSTGNGAKRPATIVIGSSAAGHTAGMVDYLCDGTADQVEINAAIGALSSNGGCILLLNGTYNLTAGITVNKTNVTIAGCGNSTRISTTAAVSAITVSGTYCCIRDIMIIGGSATGMTGISITGTQCTVHNCYVNGCNAGILITGTHAKISDCTVSAITTVGINVNGAKALVTGNHVYGASRGVAIRVMNTSEVTVSNNNTQVSSSAYNISVSSSTKCVVTGNTTYGGITGIDVNGTNSQPMFCTVSNNVMTESNICMQLANSNSNTIIGNVIQRASYTADDYSLYIFIASNNIISCNRFVGKNYTELGGANNTFFSNLAV